MLAHDLIKTVKNPFESIEKRKKRIWFFGCALVLLVGPYWLIVSLFDLYMTGDQPSCGDFRFEFLIKPYEALLLFIYFTYALYACIFAARSLFRKGMNQEMRKIIIYR